MPAYTLNRGLISNPNPIYWTHFRSQRDRAIITVYSFQSYSYRHEPMKCLPGVDKDVESSKCSAQYNAHVKRHTYTFRYFLKTIARKLNIPTTKNPTVSKTRFNGREGKPIYTCYKWHSTRLLILLYDGHRESNIYLEVDLRESVYQHGKNYHEIQM